MRLFNLDTNRSVKRRRGLSFIEIIVSLVIIGLLGSAVFASAAILNKNTKETMAYTEMRIQVINTIETIQADLEAGYEGGAEPIDAKDYSDHTGAQTGYITSVVVTDVGEVFGKSLYRVDIKVCPTDYSTQLSATTFMREGCTAFDA